MVTVSDAHGILGMPVLGSRMISQDQRGQMRPAWCSLLRTKRRPWNRDLNFNSHPNTLTQPCSSLITPLFLWQMVAPNLIICTPLVSDRAQSKHARHIPFGWDLPLLPVTASAWKFLSTLPVPSAPFFNQPLIFPPFPSVFSFASALTNPLWDKKEGYWRSQETCLTWPYKSHFPSQDLRFSVVWGRNANICCSVPSWLQCLEPRMDNTGESPLEVIKL